VAEGLLEGIIGGEEEKVDATEGGIGPIVAAVAANFANQSPESAADTAAMFRKQTEVLEIQKKNLEAEYEFFESEWGPRLLALRLRTAFQVLLALFASVIGFGLALVIWQGVHSRNVVIDSFDIAPNVAAEVPSGKIVAAGLLDVLTRIQAASRSNIEHRNLSNAWTSEIEIEVPETGISIGQLERMIKTRFGHDQHIEGDLVKTATGIALTVRGSGILAKTFTGDAEALDSLLTQGGEYIFGQSQPGLWTAYLSNTNRNEEAVRFAQSAYSSVEASERPYVLNYWANAISNLGGPGAMAEGLPLYREAIHLRPDFWIGYNNIMSALINIGDEEGVVRVGKEMIQVAGGRPGRADENQYQNYDQVVWDLPAERAEEMADLDAHGGVGTTTAATGAENLQVIQIEVQMHNLAAATLRMKASVVDEKNRADVAQAAMDRALIAEESEDLKTAAREWDTFAATYADPVVATSSPFQICYAAVTYERTGQPAKADAALKPFGDFTFVDCYRFKGDLLDMRGDWSGAQEWYAKAVKLGPSVPSGYYSWGVALAKHGDLTGAAEKFRQANLKSPHWADPLKVWGDLLLQHGDRKDALTKYDAALKYAPNWQQLKEKRDSVAKEKT